jgi:beta-glucosidase
VTSTRRAATDDVSVNETQVPITEAVQWPGTPETIEYKGKLEIGYRLYEAHGETPLFPFGYGLSYGAQFGYSSLAVTPAIAAQPTVVRTVAISRPLPRR